MKPIEAYAIINHGVEWSNYFQGCSVRWKEFTDVATGTGNSEYEAADDAMDQLARADWDTDSNADLLADIETASKHDDVQDHVDTYCKDSDCGEFPHVYISIRVR